jgi:error-prone DNA polymerase
MMAVLKDCQELVPKHYGEPVDLAQLPEDDEVYRTLQRADTVGMFQVESRAQMASLPRNRPEKFYDVVVQVAIIRPRPHRWQNDASLYAATPETGIHIHYPGRNRKRQ